jgi:diguanylate cyclase (GGDEF)-like protein
MAESANQNKDTMTNTPSMFPEENRNPVLRVGPDGVVMYANRASLPLMEAWGIQVGQALSQGWQKLVSDVIELDHDHEIDMEVGERVFSVRLTPINDAGYVNFYGSDITERKAYEEQVESLARFPEENPNPVLRIGPDGVVMYANWASLTLLDTWKSQTGLPLPQEWQQSVADVLKTGQDNEIEMEAGQRIFSIRLTPIKKAGYVNMYGTDITERKAYERQLSQLTNYDELTGLPNKNLFSDRLQRDILHAKQEGEQLAVVLVGLDGFKEINKERGRDAGDTLLEMVASCLPHCVPETATVARLNSDIFAIVQPDLDQASGAAAVALQAMEIFSKPYNLSGELVEINASIGISLFPSDGEEVELLLRNADLAMFRAKTDSRRNSYRFYKEDMNAEVQDRRDLIRDLRYAVERNQLEIYYQPQIRLTDNQLIGMEALLRWHHDKKGFISPGRFIPLAEESRLIIPIGLWVLENACRQNIEWQKAGLPHMKMSVNLSSVQFSEPDIIKTIAEVIEKNVVDPKYLELEITESVAMEGAGNTIATLEALHGLGLSLSIDDFGTGYSSLSYLKKFPVSKVKIDQSFVREMESNSEDAALCNAVIQLGHGLNLQVIAEGVESEGQRKMLVDLDCDQIQGYLYSRPLPAADFEQFVRDWGKKR